MTALAITWMTPLTGIVVASVLVPLLVALYFLKLRRRPAGVPSTLLWKRSVEDVRANTPFQRLRPSLLLLLQLGLLAFVAFALMQPRMDLGLGSGGRTVIIVDASCSMGAKDLDGARTRLDVAKEQAKARVEAIFAGGLFTPAPGETMVIAFGDAARVMQPFTRSSGDLMRAIDRIEPTDGASRIGDALALARAFATVVNPDAPGAAPEPATLELWSDGRIADLDAEGLRPGERLVYHVTGRADAANLGIEGIAAERSATDPGLIQVFVTLRNDGPDAVETDLELFVDGQRRAVTPRPVRVAAATAAGDGAARPAGAAPYKPGYERVTFPPFVQPRAGVLRVQVVRADLLEADNRAEVAVAAPRRLKIAAVGPLDQFTRFVVQSLPSERTQQLSAEDFAKLGPRSDEFDVVVAAPGALPRPIPPGRYLVLGVPAGIEGLNPYGTKDGLSVRSQRGEHPVLRAVNLDDLRVAKAVAMAPATDIEPIVEGADVPLVLVARRGPVTAVLTAFEPLDTNWPWQRAFPTFIANAVEWLGGIDQAAVGEEHRPGDTLSVRVAAGTKDTTVVTPDGGRQVLPAREGSVTFGPVTRAGAYSFTWSDERGEQRRDFAVVPAMGEGRIAAAPELSVGTQTVAGTAGGAGTLSDLWPYALAAALVLLVVEWWAYHRRHWIRAAPGARAVRPIGSREPLGGGAPIMRP
jgi:hypothetical protein